MFNKDFVMALSYISVINNDEDFKKERKNSADQDVKF